MEPLLSFINKQLDGENQDKLPRGDYKEFLELAKIFLGGDVDRKKGYIFQLSRPGADHHARWMSNCIYFLKLFLLSDQFPQSQLSWQKKKKSRPWPSLSSSPTFNPGSPLLLSWELLKMILTSSKGSKRSAK